MKQLTNENAANRSSYVGSVYNVGERAVKNEVLSSLPPEWSCLHREGYIHIHDLDAYGKTYNCLTFNFLNAFPYKQFEGLCDSGKIVRLFGFIKTLFADMGNEQSGGMAFANFDNELATVFEKLGVRYNESNCDLIAEAIADLLLWCNNTHTRMGQTSYYVTLNIGLAENEFARFIAYSVIEQFEKLGDTVYKPNIVFKVCKGVSRFEDDRNFDLYRKALLCTAKKMIPTYLLCDCVSDREIAPDKLSVMGCRTRVVDDIYGKSGAIGRGNIDNISINLPRLALEIDRDHRGDTVSQKIDLLRKKWLAVADVTKEILLDRYNKILSLSIDDFPSNATRQLWCISFEDIPEVFKHGTLSIGFIGLSEAMEILCGKRFYNDAETYRIALDFVAFMREYCNKQRDTYKLNFSLLATSGELISGRFSEIDSKQFSPEADVFSKGFYTNSFHVNVDSGISAREKLIKEGPFHALSNGGCISYIELNEAPIGNDEGLRELVEEAVEAGVRYMGINFPKDICDDCGISGVFDECPACCGKKITRIRRVSGYLEILDGFTNGKKNEVKSRKSN